MVKYISSSSSSRVCKPRGKLKWHIKDQVPWPGGQRRLKSFQKHGMRLQTSPLPFTWCSRRHVVTSYELLCLSPLLLVGGAERTSSVPHKQSRKKFLEESLVSKCDMLTKVGLMSGPSSTKLAQYQINIGPTCCASSVIDYIIYSYNISKTPREFPFV